MLKPPALHAAIAAARPRAITLNTVVFRSIHLRHFSNFSTVQPLLAARGGSAGSRFVRPNGPAALYTAFHAATAYREGNQRYFQTAATRGGQKLIPEGGLRPDPVIIIGAHVRATSLLDLRNEDTLLRLGIRSKAEMRTPWKGVPNAPTQELGAAVFRDRHFEGIVYWSVQNPGYGCLVLFPDRLQPESRIDFFDSTSCLAAHLSRARRRRRFSQ